MVERERGSAAIAGIGLLLIAAIMLGVAGMIFIAFGAPSAGDIEDLESGSGVEITDVSCSVIGLNKYACSYEYESDNLSSDDRNACFTRFGKTWDRTSC